MYHFKRMIECVRERGVLVEPSIRAQLNATDEDLNVDFFKFVKECQPIVFSPRDGETQTIEETYGDVELDGPFKIFSIEMSNGFLTVPNSEARSAGKGVTISCVMCVEMKPRHYFQYVLFENNRKSLVTVFNVDSLVELFLKRLNTDDLGVQQTKERVRVGKSKDKEILEVRKIVVCSPRKSHLETYGGRDVDWSHRWSVRGHWRKLANPDSIGKDRSGQYCVPGMTWTSEHIKGPEHLKVVDKVRLIRT